MSKRSAFFVLFSGPTTLEEAGAALEEAGLQVRRTETGTLEIANAEFELGLSGGPQVRREAQGLASRKRASALGGFDRRFEVTVEDLGAALSEYTSLAITQQTLLDLTQGVAWLQWNDSILQSD